MEGFDFKQNKVNILHLIFFTNFSHDHKYNNGNNCFEMFIKY